MAKMPRQKPGRSIQTVGTPPEFVAAACLFLGIDSFAWDLAATEGMNECSPFGCYTKERSALDPANGWNFAGQFVWLNPEFAEIGPWVEKAWRESRAGARIAVLIPASIGARWWIDWVADKATIVPLDGRITFVGQTDPYPKDCALLLYGSTPPGYTAALKWMDLLTDEEREMAKKRTKKQPKTPKAFRAKMDKKLTRADKVRPIAEGRKKKRTPPPEDPDVTGERAAASAARITTFRPNGGSSTGPLPDPDAPDLGPILLPDPEDAQRVLKELAELNDRALNAKARYETLKEATKGAKEKYDELAEMVLTRLRVSTHKSDLPLFDAAEREQDLAAMQAGGEIDPGTEPDASPASEQTEEAPMVGDGTIDAPSASSEPEEAAPIDTLEVQAEIEAGSIAGVLDPPTLDPADSVF